MSSTTTNFMHAGKPFQAELYNPSKTPNGSLIMIVHGSDGMVDNSNGPWLTMMRGYASDLADKGCITLMPDYLGKDKSGNVNPVDYMQLPAYQAILADAVAYAKTLPGVDAKRIGLLGFSLGGNLCLRNRSLAQVLVEFFAPLSANFGGIGATTNSSLYAQIHQGDKDELVHLESDAKPIEQQLRSEGADVTLIPSYPNAGHGFSGKYSGDAAAQKKSKEHTLAFFEKHL